MAQVITNMVGDFLTSGDLVNPILNQVLLDTGLFLGKTENNWYFNINIILQSTVAARFEIGIFDISDIPYRTFKFDLIGAQSGVIRLDNLPINGLQKFKIRTGVAIIGTVNVAINLCAMGRD